MRQFLIETLCFLSAAWLSAWLHSANAQDAKPVADRTEQLKLPPWPVDSITGSQFYRKIETVLPRDREAAIVEEITHGNIPAFLRSLKAIPLEATDDQGIKHVATCYVMRDYLAVGTDNDFFRVPMMPVAAQKIADAADASLITVKLSDEIFRHADIKLEPRPLTKDRDATATFFQHHQIIEGQRKAKELGLLVVGIKKDVVLTNRLKEKPHRVAIYGWHYPDGRPIQPLYTGHTESHVDYSHGIRLVSRHMVVDGQPMEFEKVLKSPTLCALLSNEGPVDAGYK
jgi:hypothetical protein